MSNKYPSRQNVVDVNQQSQTINVNNSELSQHAIVYIGKGIKQSNRTTKRERIKSTLKYKFEFRAYPSDAFRISKSIVKESLEIAILQPINNVFADLVEVYRIETGMNTSVTICN